MPKLFRTLFPRPSERWIANIFLLVIIAYLLGTGYIYLKKGLYTEWSWGMLIMLIPVFLVDGFKTLFESFYPKKIVLGVEDLTKVTVIIPTFNGQKVLAATLESLLKRFSPTQIIVSSNGSTDQSCAIANHYGIRLLEITQPIGKVEAINQALHFVNTPYVLIMDDDTLIGQAIIPTSELDSGRGAVAFRVFPIKAGFASLIQSHEYRKSMDVGRRYHNHTASVQNISGAIGLFRTVELLRQTALHNGEFSGEDLQRTLLVHLARASTGGVVMSESIVETVVPNNFRNLFLQRVYGWYPGFLANFNLYFRLIFKKSVPLRLRIEAFYNCFLLAALDPFRLISLPILLFTPVYLVFFYFIYIVLETIPYIMMGRKEPYWIILIFPLYGLINFIARMLAMSVFFYRRIAKFIGRSTRPDGHKFIGFFPSLGGIVCSLVVTILIFIFYGAAVVTTDRSKYEVFEDMVSSTSIVTVKKANLLSPSINLNNTLLTTIANDKLNEPVISIIKPEESLFFVVQPGDSQWLIAQRAINKYLDQNQLDHNHSQQFAANLVQLMGKKTIKTGETVEIATVLISQAVTE